MTMDVQEEKGAERKSRKGLFGLLCVLAGLLLGACVMLLVFNVKGLHRPSEIRIIERDTASARDTVVIIHEFKNPNRSSLSADSLSIDTTMLEEESQDLLLAYPDDLDEGMAASVPAEVMLDQMTPKVIVWDNNQKEVPNADKADNFQIQLWSTPFKNRIEYFFEGNVIKVKGLMIDNLKVLRYKNELYLISQKRVYPIHQNKQFEKLVETHDFSL